MLKIGSRVHQCAGAALIVFNIAVTDAEGQNAPAAIRSGWEINGLPALNFDADEGFGYGLIGQLYKHGGGVEPYQVTVQPTIFFTTKGRRDYTIFIDSPRAFGSSWRIDAYAGKERQLSTPYYGTGNAASINESLQAEPNNYYYRFGRERMRVLANVQHPLGAPSLRVLGGVGLQSVDVDATPFDQSTTFLTSELNGSAVAKGNLNYARVGLVFDSRDVEIGTRSGTWADILAQRFDGALGSTHEYTRITGTLRHYRPVARSVVFAGRFIAQNINGDAPFYDLATIQSSYKEAEGLGGSSSVRGLPKNRYIGKGIVLANTELRWNAASFSLRGKPSALILNTFVDGGRVWKERLGARGEERGLHTGYGAGARLGYGGNFVVAVDVGHSSASMAPVYIGLGYMF